METKTCTKCHETKPVSEFHKNRSTKDGLQYQCKSCRHVHDTSEHKREYSREWHKANAEHRHEYGRKYRASNKLRTAVRKANSRAPGVLTEEAAQAIYESQNHHCFYCKVDLDVVGWELDHLQPVSKGGTNGPVNIVFACKFCNRGKNHHTAEEFLDYLSGVVDRWPKPE